MVEASKDSIDLVVEELKGHTDEVNCLAVLEDAEFMGRPTTLMVSASEDQYVRLWDMRMKTSVKRYGCPQFKDSAPTNVAFSPCGTEIYATSDANFLTFDVRTDSILISEPKLTRTVNADEINQIHINPANGLIGLPDDNGDIHLLSTSEENKHLAALERGHKNICNTVFVTNKTDVFTAGFDCKILKWNREKCKVKQELDMVELFSTLGSSTTINPPHVYSLDFNQRFGKLLVALGNGSIVALTPSKLDVPSHCLDAHQDKVVQARYAGWNFKTAISISSDQTMAFWNLGKNGVESFVKPNQYLIRRYQLDNKPNWVAPSQNGIFVADTSNKISYFTLKG
mmetsp:Transcript_55889/g.63801  ORF Transcript_55889/g.63801 Transcript_55889/m.63801 type:complete len:341 (+) Transcript_55889:92-1114(+)